MLSAALTDWRWCNGLVNELPARFERKVVSQYTEKYKNNPVQANVSLRILMKQLKRLKMPLSAISSDTMAASWGVEQCRKIWTNSRGNYQSRHGTMQIDFFGTADHAEALGLTEFEHETAKQYAVEAGRKAPAADDVRKAKASVTRWNRDRLRVGLGAIV